MTEFSPDIQVEDAWLDVPGDWSGKSVLVQNKSSEHMLVFLGASQPDTAARDGVWLNSYSQMVVKVGYKLFLFGDGRVHVSEAPLLTMPAAAVSDVPTSAGVQLDDGSGEITGVSAALITNLAWLEDGAGNLLWTIVPGTNDTFSLAPISYGGGLVLKCAALVTHTENVVVNIISA